MEVGGISGGGGDKIRSNEIGREETSVFLANKIEIDSTLEL